MSIYAGWKMSDRIRIQRRKQFVDSYSYPQLVTDTSGLRMGTTTALVSHDIGSISLRPQARLTVIQPGDFYEQEADRLAQQVMGIDDRANNNTIQRETSLQEEENLQLKSLGNTITPLIQQEETPSEEEEEEEELVQAKSSRQRFDDGELAASSDISNKLHSRKGQGKPLADSVRTFMEPRFGVNFDDVKVHTDGEAVQMARKLGAQAFTFGNDVYFGAGKAPGNNELTAHELTHVVQQTGAVQSKAISNPGITQIGMKRIQRNLSQSLPVTHGAFEVDMQTRQGALSTPPTQSGLDGYIRFVPNLTAPNSNPIVMIQIVKLTDLGGADVNSATTPAAQAPRGTLGQPGLRTQDDADRGIEGGFKTDVHHRPNSTAPGVTQGSPLSPRYNFQPAAPGTTGVVGQTAQPAQYGGGIGGNVGQTPGFKRSNNAADIRSASLYDTPGTASAAANLNFSFETAARGEDTMINYGAVKWGFGLRAGRVVDEYISVQDTQSATFDETLERHRDFYVHEPVTFYFDFNKDKLNPSEAAKIDAFLAYLGRNPDVQMSLEGFADVSGRSSAYNADLSLRRAQSVEAALLSKGIAASRIDGIIVGSGASTAATTDAGTGDQGGNPAVGADQNTEANRWANRRVVLTFRHVPAATPAPGGTP